MRALAALAAAPALAAAATVVVTIAPRGALPSSVITAADTVVFVQQPDPSSQPAPVPLVEVSAVPACAAVPSGFSVSVAPGEQSPGISGLSPGIHFYARSTAECVAGTFGILLVQAAPSPGSSVSSGPTTMPSSVSATATTSLAASQTAAPSASSGSASATPKPATVIIAPIPIPTGSSSAPASVSMSPTLSIIAAAWLFAFI
ncbi:hypothetical protein HK105_207052 [Polyrhizophydium stewartii]|uniref:Uncharacterized protein n=1 Tax=Polyrhizophydium stewartii TaxID=2732419 RepID=A0ABR4N1P5_9FUNG